MRTSHPFAEPRAATCPDLAAFEALAASFAAVLCPGDVVGLDGPLGSGKTTFVRAVVRARLGDDLATSPTFTFWHRYPGDPPIDHIDLYRVEKPDELRELGLEEAFGGASIVLVEWWCHAPELMPRRRYEVTIEGSGEGPRSVRVVPPR
jgi:tRNA threonylcarbamoyl adenosine modification protein YjeE